MPSDLIIAFITTVLGLAIVRRRWLEVNVEILRTSLEDWAKKTAGGAP